MNFHTMRQPKSQPACCPGFTLVELLVVLGIIGVLAAVLVPTALRSQRAAERADSTARLRTMGQAILSYAGDNDQRLPGPMWPGQVMLFDPNREGRLVRDLADYLEVERRDAPYLVERLIPQAYRRAMKGTNLGDVRVYVLNSAVTRDNELLDPFGTGTLTKPQGGGSPTMKLVQLQGLNGTNTWMMAEADQKLPAVASASWKANTPATPVHDKARAVVRFDGSVGWESIP